MDPKRISLGLAAGPPPPLFFSEVSLVLFDLGKLRLLSKRERPDCLLVSRNASARRE